MANSQTVTAEIERDKIDAVLFDMDGVVTRTAVVHFAAWKEVFDELLKKNAGDGFKEFTHQDYLDYVDGKPREDGVRDFIASRGIKLPETADGNAPSIESISKQKDAKFMERVHNNGVETYETTVVLIRELKRAGIQVALVTASKNGEAVLEAANLSHIFDATVTGVDAEKMNLKGKPAPDVFLEAAKRLNVSPQRAVVVEDAEAGVESGKNGGFAIVIGVAREGNSDELKKHGASIVVRDLAEVEVDNEGKKGNLGSALRELDITDSNWVIEYTDYQPSHVLQRESICALGNGKFCTRGSESGSTIDDIHYPGTYVSGAYDSVTMKTDSMSMEREELVNMPNWLYLTFKIDDAPHFSIDNGKILSYSKRLNLHEGVLYRDLHFEHPDGKQTKLRERRFVHMRHSHLGGVQMELTPVNWSGKLSVRSAIDGNVTNGGETIDPTFKALTHLKKIESAASGEIISLKITTMSSNIVVAQAARTRVRVDGNLVDVPRTTVDVDRFIGQDLAIDAVEGKTVVVDKVASLFTSRDKGIYEPGASSTEAVTDADSFDDLVASHMAAWESLWQQFDLFIETSEQYSKLKPSLLLHLNSFHTLQTASMHTVDLDCGIPARSWTGEGYQGHVFWDDLFVFPFINLRMPNISAALLKYRYRRLGEARKIAKSRGAIGACFPWQSASDGKEKTPDYWWLAATKKWIRDYTSLEFHVNGAIAYNVWLYFMATLDTDFMRSYGSEVILEIARFFASISKFNEEKQRYEIMHVIGPDEFHSGYPGTKEPGVNNNAYTNILAVWTITTALRVVEKIPSDHREHICQRLQLEQPELDYWKDVTQRMYLPIMSNGILAQFDGYEELEDFPTSEDGNITEKDLNQALADNDGYLNQYKLSKQSDVLMLGFLFREDILRELVEKLGYNPDCVDFERLAEYYLPRTSNQSTLSRVGITWILSRISRHAAKRLMQNQQNAPKQDAPAAVNERIGESEANSSSSIIYSNMSGGSGVFFDALGSDYFDVASRGTTKSGVHMGAMAGTVDIVQRCYPGLTFLNERLNIDPALPNELIRLNFNLNYRGQSLNLDLNHDRIKITARHSIADPVTMAFRDEVFDLAAGEVREFDLKQNEANP